MALHNFTLAPVAAVRRRYRSIFAVPPRKCGLCGQPYYRRALNIYWELGPDGTTLVRRTVRLCLECHRLRGFEIHDALPRRWPRLRRVK